MEDITVKVSVEDYVQALSDLRIEYGHLQGALTRLQDNRRKLEGNFISKTLTPELIRMIKDKEKQVQKSIDNVQVQINKIENRLTSHETAEKNVQAKISQAAQKNASAFM